MNVIAEKSLAFAIKNVKLAKYLIEERREYVLSKQLVRSGTAIGALAREAEHAQSKADFLHKMNIALKDANETVYWLILLKETDYITIHQFSNLCPDAEELLRLLISIVKTTKENLGKL